MYQFCGHLPDDDEDARRQKKGSGVTSQWLVERFSDLPENPDEETVQRYARVWLWYFLGSFLFPDASGNTISWMFLDILRQPWENIAAYSWGTAVLAWTYRKLCEACRRTKGTANLGGCAYLLQIWCWERWPVRRPGRVDLTKRAAPQDGDDGLLEWNGEDTNPTALYIWRDSEQVTGKAHRKYKEYTDTLDLLTQYQVRWCPWDDEALQQYLSYQCWEESDDFLYIGPLIFFHVVEIHLLIRVCRQFGLATGYPPPLYSTNPTLHSYKRRKR